MAKLTFAFDFDNTITRDPDLFDFIMKGLQIVGHKVYIVTGRLTTTHPEDLDPWGWEGFQVFFTEHKAKRKYMEDLGIKVDIWVDDLPESVCNDWDGPPRTFRDGLINIDNEPKGVIVND